MKANTKRTTIYLDSDLHLALRIKAAETEQSISELAQEAIRDSLADDASDLAAFEERAGEPSLPFENVLKKLKRDGKI